MEGKRFQALQSDERTKASGETSQQPRANRADGDARLDRV
jgi:hypothetical protein